MTTPSHLRLWRGAGVAAAVIGSQSLVAALPQPGNALMLLPSEGAIAGLGDGLRRGFLLAQDQARICTNQQTDWSIGWMSDRRDIANQLRHRRLPPVVLAPPAAPLVPSGLLAQERQRQVLLPLQRGISLQQLASRPGSDRLWPVSASRSLEIDVLVKALLEQNKKRFMLITDGTADQLQLADRFLETMENQGGSLIGLDDGPRSLNGEDPKALDRLALDVDWFRPQALVVMTTNNSPLMQGVLNESWPQTLTLVWNVAPRYNSLQPQLGVAEANRGPGWEPFSRSFEQRYGYTPGTVEASGYDAGQLVALSVISGQQQPTDGMSSFDPDAKALPYCAALRQASGGGSVKPTGAGSNLDLKAATPPTAILDVIQKAPDGAETRTSYDLGAS